eukprot:scaffold7647_cov129-Skeletonema_marinoi.AAC.2
MVVASGKGRNGAHPVARWLGRLISPRRGTALIIVYLSYTLLCCDAFTEPGPGNSIRITPRNRHRRQDTHGRISHLKPLGTTTFLGSSKSKYNINRQSSKKNKPLQQKMQQQAAPMFLFPWSILLKIRSVLPHENNIAIINSKSSKRRRWEMPLTSKPFQGVEELQSTIKNCMLALAVYFAIGTCVFPFLEPSWTVIDAMYFSMTTLTTVAYGDLVASTTTFGKLFLLSFNIYAVCISVSALGIIAKLALAQEKKIIKQAKQQARARLVRLFRDEEEHDDEEKEEVEVSDDDWVDNIYLDKCDDDNEEPQTMMSALRESLQRHAFNFCALIGLASVIGKVEKWSLVDIIYFWNCTATTMGYGDIAPQTQIGRLLAVVFIPLSVITLGEVIASCVAHLNARAAAKAEKDFLRREITFDDLDHLDVNDDGKVCQLDFITFMLMAMQKVDRKTMKDLTSLFKALDTEGSGFIEKEDLILLRQRKRLAKRLRREARHKKKLYDKGYPRIENRETEHVYDHLKGYRIN